MYGEPNTRAVDGGFTLLLIVVRVREATGEGRREAFRCGGGKAGPGSRGGGELWP